MTNSSEQKARRFWWIAIGVVIGMLIGSPRLSVSIQQCDSAAQQQGGRTDD